VIAGLIVLLVSASSVLYVVFLGGLLTPQNDAFTPSYFYYEGSESKIYMVSATYTFTISNQTYTSENGQKITKGSQLNSINFTLRNDYSSDKPHTFNWHSDSTNRWHTLFTTRNNPAKQ
jgi:hypothetical protein